MNLNEFIQKEIRTTLNGRINEGRPIPMDTPNTFIYPEFKMYASKNKKMFKKELEKSKGDSSKMFLTLSALWYKWARKNHKEFTHIKENLKFGRALMLMMVKDDVIFSIDAFKKTNNITKLKEDIVDQAFLDAKPVEDEDESVEEAAKRDYKKEYEKYGKSEKAKKYRAELNKYNRDKGTYGNGDGKDASHKGGKIVGFEDESKNRGRAEKSRLKKEATFTPNSGTMSGGVLQLDNRKYQLKKDIKNVKIGNYIVTLPKGTILYNIAGGLFADHKSLEQYADRNRQYFKKPTFKGIQITQKTDTIKDIDKNSKVLESINEFDSSINKRRAGAELKQKLKGKRSDGMGKYTATIYGLDSKGKRVELKSLNDLNKYSKFEIDESVNEGKYYITRNLGRGQGKALIKHYDRKKMQTTDKPIEFKSYKDAQKEVDKLKSGGSMGGQMTAYIITDKKMNPLTEEQIDEKLITFSNRAPYGQIVFMAGGAGSGKGFAIDNFIDSAGFKVRDVDEMKKAVGKLDQLGKFSVDKWYKKYGKKLSDKPKGGGLSPKAHIEEFVLGKGMTISDISNDLKNPNNVASLHYIVDSMGLKDKWLISMLSGKNNKETLPNLMFDITAKKVSAITDVIKPLLANGYDSKSVHLIWVLANFHVAIKANKERDRMVPEDILLQTHEGAGKTMWELMTKISPKGLNGRIDVILNKRAETVPYVDSNGKPIMVEPNQKNKLKDAQIVVKGFTSLPIKKQGGGIQPESAWKEILKKWVLDNAPKTIDLSQNLGESVNEASDTYFKTAGEAVDFAKTKAEKKGYEIDEDDWNNQITHGGRYSRLRPSVGKTHTFQIGLLKKGKPQRKGLSISLFGMDSGNYELTYYIN